MQTLLRQIKACTICQEHLPYAPKPVLAASKNSQIVIVGHAPGSKVQETGIPWDDQSGKLLRSWMGVTNEVFYNPEKIAIIPMGFCYPGKGKSGDLPPRPECAPAWHDKLLTLIPEWQMVILIGQHAQKYYLQDQMERNLTETVKNFEAYLPRFFPLPHPSPRNRFWLQKNPWFAQDVLPKFQASVQIILGDSK